MPEDGGTFRWLSSAWSGQTGEFFEDFELEDAGDQSEVSPEIIADVRDLFLDTAHWIYRSPGTASLLAPDSVFHIGQLEVLFEANHFHWRTNRAIRQLKADGFLLSRDFAYSTGTAQVVWRRNMRYVARKAHEHVDLIAEYSSETMSKACGDYAETLTLLGLRGLDLKLIGRNTRRYRDKEWVETQHDLDFIFERDGVGFGVEVKNTWNYMPNEELAIKLRMCEFLDIKPLFVVRNRHSRQWDDVKAAGGMLYKFQTKVFPPGQEALTRRIWQSMRLPVAVWHDWRGPFYTAIGSYVTRTLGKPSS